jgi:hypothetical protein
MRVVSVTVTYARTFNLGDYNSMRLECDLAAEVDEDEDPAAAQAELFDLAKSTVKAQALPVLKRREDEIAAIRDSLPPGTLGGN